MRKSIFCQLTTVLAAGALLLSSCANYRSSYHTWDVDGDQQLAREEFYRGAYGTWDSDSDGLVRVHEFEYGWRNSGFFDRWDRDNDGVLSRDEYDDGWADLDVVDEHVLGAFDLWDVIDDDQLTPAEVENGLYAFWDVDNDDFLEYHEFSAALDTLGLWDLWDADQDTYLTVTEVYTWDPEQTNDDKEQGDPDNS